MKARLSCAPCWVPFRSSSFEEHGSAVTVSLRQPIVHLREERRKTFRCSYADRMQARDARRSPWLSEGSDLAVEGGCSASFPVVQELLASDVGESEQLAKSERQPSHIPLWKSLGSQQVGSSSQNCFFPREALSAFSLFLRSSPGFSDGGKTPEKTEAGLKTMPACFLLQHV